MNRKRKSKNRNGIKGGGYVPWKVLKESVYSFRAASWQAPSVMSRILIWSFGWAWGPTADMDHLPNGLLRTMT